MKACCSAGGLLDIGWNAELSCLLELVTKLEEISFAFIKVLVLSWLLVSETPSSAEGLGQTIKKTLFISILFIFKSKFLSMLQPVLGYLEIKRKMVATPMSKLTVVAHPGSLATYPMLNQLFTIRKVK